MKVVHHLGFSRK